MSKITYYGQSCFGLEHNGLHILFDPFISGNALANDIDMGTIKADFILLSHAHQDHVLDVEAIAQRSGATLISNFEIITYYGEKGLQGHPMNHGGSHTFEFGRVKMVNAIHTSSFADGTYGGNPAGFVISLENGATFYYSGDTALTYDMKLIGEEYALDYAFLCLGDNFTMGIEDAARAAQFVGTHDVIGMHFDTFAPIEIDHARAETIFRDAGLNLKLPKIGEHFER